MATPSTHLPNPHHKAPLPPEVGDFRAEKAKSSPATELDVNFQQWLPRLTKEIAAVRQRSKVNLAIGVSIFAVATGPLASALLFETPASSLLEAAIHLLPRVAFSLFIGGFSIFFLRLYSAAAGEIRYYENEITNIHMRLIALGSANDSVTRGIAIKALSNTERNPILKKGHTTDELERAKIEFQNQSQALGAILKTLKRNG